MVLTKNGNIVGVRENVSTNKERKFSRKEIPGRLIDLGHFREGLIGEGTYKRGGYKAS